MTVVCPREAKTWWSFPFKSSKDQFYDGAFWLSTTFSVFCCRGQMNMKCRCNSFVNHITNLSIHSYSWKTFFSWKRSWGLLLMTRVVLALTRKMLHETLDVRDICFSRKSNLAFVWNKMFHETFDVRDIASRDLWFSRHLLHENKNASRDVLVEEVMRFVVDHEKQMLHEMFDSNDEYPSDPLSGHLTMLSDAGWAGCPPKRGCSRHVPVVPGILRSWRQWRQHFQVPWWEIGFGVGLVAHLQLTLVWCKSLKVDSGSQRMVLNASRVATAPLTVKWESMSGHMLRKDKI